MRPVAWGSRLLRSALRLIGWNTESDLQPPYDAPTYVVVDQTQTYVVMDETQTALAIDRHGTRVEVTA